MTTGEDIDTDGYELTIDLQACTIVDDHGLSLAFELDEFRLTPGLIEDEVRHYPLSAFEFQEGKITLPVVLAFRRGSESERQFWRRTMEDLEQEPGDLERARRLALGDPDAVPAGIYARLWLEGQGLEDINEAVGTLEYPGAR